MVDEPTPTPKRRLVLEVYEDGPKERLHIQAEGIDSDIVENDLARALTFVRRLNDVRTLKQELARGILLERPPRSDS